MRINFVGPSYRSRSPNVDDQILVNMYQENVESGDGISPQALYPTPGLKAFADLTPIPSTMTFSGSGTDISVEVTPPGPDRMALCIIGNDAIKAFVVGGSPSNTSGFTAVSGGSNGFAYEGFKNLSTGDPITITATFAASCHWMMHVIFFKLKPGHTGAVVNSTTTSFAPWFHPPENTILSPVTAGNTLMSIVLVPQSTPTSTPLTGLALSDSMGNSFVKILQENDLASGGKNQHFVSYVQSLLASGADTQTATGTPINIIMNAAGLITEFSGLLEQG